VGRAGLALVVGILVLAGGAAGLADSAGRRAGVAGEALVGAGSRAGTTGGSAGLAAEAIAVETSITDTLRSRCAEAATSTALLALALTVTDIPLRADTASCG
jgi:pectate lyase